VIVGPGDRQHTRRSWSEPDHELRRRVLGQAARVGRREAEFQARVADLQARLAKCQQLAEQMQWQRQLPIAEQLARQIIVEAQGSTE
jgi:hypothetical protein